MVSTKSVTEVTTVDQLNWFYDDWSLTFEGVEMSDKNLDFLNKFFAEHGSKLEGEIFLIKGKFMNKVYELTGDNAYANNLNILVIPQKCFDSKKMALPMREIGGRWFTDVVDNNHRRESKDW